MRDPDHQHYAIATIAFFAIIAFGLGAWGMVIAEIGWGVVYGNGG